MRRSNADSFQVEREKIYTTKATARVFQLSALIKMFSYINALRSTRHGNGQQAEHLSGRKCLGELESKHAHTANPTWYKNVKAPAKEFGLSYPNLFLAIEFVGMSQLQIIFQFLNFSISAPLTLQRHLNYSKFSFKFYSIVQFDPRHANAPAQTNASFDIFRA